MSSTVTIKIALVNNFFKNMSKRIFLELFENKGTGLLDLLNEEVRLPRSSTQHFTTAVHQSNVANKRLMVNQFLI